MQLINSSLCVLLPSVRNIDSDAQMRGESSQEHGRSNGEKIALRKTNCWVCVVQILHDLLKVHLRAVAPGLQERIAVVFEKKSRRPLNHPGIIAFRLKAETSKLFDNQIGIVRAHGQNHLGQFEPFAWRKLLHLAIINQNQPVVIAEPNVACVNGKAVRVNGKAVRNNDNAMYQVFYLGAGPH